MSWPSLFRVGLPASVLSVALLGSLPDGSSAQRPPVREGRSLSAAIEEAKRSPFHATSRLKESARARVTVGHESTGSVLRGWARPSAVEQETSRRGPAPSLSGVSVFLTTSFAAALSNAAACGLILTGAYSPRDSGSGGLLIVAGGAAAMIGPAFGAKLAGGRFLPGVLGSVVGVGLGGIAVAAIGIERGVHGAVLFSLFSLVHAGTTTLFVMKAEQYAADGRDG